MRFQYFVHTFPASDPNLANELNQLGAQGWEMVGFELVGVNFVTVFKKPV